MSWVRLGGPAVVVAVVAQQEAAAAADIEQSIRWRERVEDRAAREVVYNDASRGQAIKGQGVDANRH